MTTMKNFKVSFSKKCNPVVKSFLEDSFKAFYSELGLHINLFPTSGSYIFNYNERAYLSMFCHSYLKSQHNRLDDVFILQEYSEGKKQGGHGRVDGLVCDKLRKSAFLIEAKLWPNTDKVKRGVDYTPVKEQLKSYKDEELSEVGLAAYHIVLIFGTIGDMSTYNKVYGNYNVEEDNTDFYCLVDDGNRGLEIYGSAEKTPLK